MRKTNQLLLPVLAIVTILAAFTILRICLTSKSNLLPQLPSSCQATSCHGYDLQCQNGILGTKSCDLMYTPADGCRQFASCQIKNSQCTQINTPKFDSCKICMDQCSLKMEDSIDGVTCQEKCLQKLIPTP